jgi:hypothetical protein
MRIEGDTYVSKDHVNHFMMDDETETSNKDTSLIGSGVILVG